MSGPPGYSFHELLLRLEERTLRNMTHGASALIELLSQRKPDEQDLVRLVEDIREPRDLLLDGAMRGAILDALPFEKKVELAARFEGPIDPEDVPRIEIESGSSDEAELLAFFGIPPRPPVQTPVGSEAIKRISPEYGLFPYQRAAVDRVSSYLEKFPRRAVLHLPTGAGKTRSAMHVICQHLRQERPRVALWLAYNRELLEQAASEFERAWSFLGDREVKVIRYWGHRDIVDAGVVDGLVVGGLDKLRALFKSQPARMLALADRVSLTVFDEAHQAVAPTYSQLADLLAEKRPDGKLLGLTATPGRTWADISADKELADFFGGRKVMLEVEGYSNPVRFLIDQGYLASPQFRTLNVDAGIALSEGDRRELSEALDIPEGMLKRLGASREYTVRVIKEILDLLSRHQRVIVFASSVAQAKVIAAVMTGMGVQSGAVTADTPTSERKRAIRAFKSNLDRPIVLVNYGVLTTGFDAPGTSAAVVARPTKSLVLFSQMVGRAIRGVNAGGNRECEIVSVTDPNLPGFGDVAEAFTNWEDVWS